MTKFGTEPRSTWTSCSRDRSRWTLPIFLTVSGRKERNLSCYFAFYVTDGLCCPNNSFLYRNLGQNDQKGQNCGVFLALVLFCEVFVLRMVKLTKYGKDFLGNGAGIWVGLFLPSPLPSLGIIFITFAPSSPLQNGDDTSCQGSLQNYFMVCGWKLMRIENLIYWRLLQEDFSRVNCLYHSTLWNGNFLCHLQGRFFNSIQYLKVLCVYWEMKVLLPMFLLAKVQTISL